MENAARVVLGLEAHDVAEEVMHFLDRGGRARVVATAADDRQLAEAVRQLDPDTVIAQPSLAAPLSFHGRALIALDTRESVASLRAAIAAGARGFFLWPAEREELARAVSESVSVPLAAARRARVVAVHGARGGAGATFVATHLAAAVARRGADCVLVDMDPVYGDVTAAIGAPADGVHTIADLLPLAAELNVDHLRDALWAHGAGFRALLAPAPEEAALVGGAELRTVIETAATACDALVLHLPRAVCELGRLGFDVADRVLEVLALDVLSFRAATRALEALRTQELAGRVGFVVNRASRSEITPADVARVFGTEPLAVVRSDHAVERAQDHGRLLPLKGRVGRTFDRIAEAVLDADG